MLFQEAGASEAEPFEPLVDVVSRFLDTAIASGEMRPGESPFLATVLVVGLHAAMLPLLHHPDADPADFPVRADDLMRRLLG